MEAGTGWREGLEQEIVYKRRFAFLKTTCSSNETVWMSWYYSVYHIWKDRHSYAKGRDVGHTDFVENITEAEFIVRRLSDGI